MTEVFSWREAPPGDYAVIGDPIAHSKSPAMHTAAYRALGLDLTYRAIHVPVDEVPEALEHLREIGYRGVNVTVPHKEAALKWSASADPMTHIVGAANTLQLETRDATNTDRVGFATSISPLTTGRHFVRPLVLGAGGSAGAVLAVLVLGVTIRMDGVAVWNRTPKRARELRDGIAARAAEVEANGRSLGKFHQRLANVIFPSVLDLSGYDLIVNATSTSLTKVDLGLDWSRAEPDALAYDLAYGVDEAPFLAGARARGLATQDGAQMLARQGLHALMFWMPDLGGENLEHDEHGVWRRALKAMSESLQ